MNGPKCPVAVKLIFTSSKLGWDANGKKCTRMETISVVRNFSKVETKDYGIK